MCSFPFPRFLLITMLLLLAAGRSFGSDVTDTIAQRLQSKLSAARTDSSKALTLLSLSSYLVNKPGSEPADMAQAFSAANKALAIAQKAGLKTSTGLSYAVISQIYRERNDVASGKKWAGKGIQFFRQYKDPVVGVAVCKEMANYYDHHSPAGLNAKIQLFEDAISCMRKVNPGSIELADGLKFLGDLHNIQERQEKAIPELKEAIAIYHANRYDKLQDIYNLIGNAYTMTGNLKGALDYNLLALKNVEKYNDTSATAIATYNRLGITYVSLGTPLKAVPIFQKALKIAEKNHDNAAYATIASNLGQSYIKLKRYGQAADLLRRALKLCPTDDLQYAANITGKLVLALLPLKRFKEAQEALDKLPRSYLYDKDADVIVLNIRLAVISLYLDTRQYDKAEPYIIDFRRLAKKYSSNRSMINAELSAFKLDSARGNWVSAIRYYQRYKILGDSINIANHDRQISQLEVQFESEQKDIQIIEKTKNIELLRRQTHLQQRMLHSQRLVRNLSFAGIALLALLLAVSYNRYKLKKRANHELSEQKEEINTQNESLQQLVTEREWLLKEIHHRVKNNLQIVISLLNSQTAYLTDPKLLDVMKESQRRMHSISLIHQKLYQGDDLSGLFMPTYIHELVQYLRSSFDLKGAIYFKLDVADITLDAAQSVPVGLILNEAITNAIKYAFSETDENIIDIKLLRDESDKITLSIIDNGRGFPQDYDYANSSSLGMSLMKGLSEQIDADFYINGSNGVHITISWILRKLPVPLN